MAKQRKVHANIICKGFWVNSKMLIMAGMGWGVELRSGNNNMYGLGDLSAWVLGVFYNIVFMAPKLPFLIICVQIFFFSHAFLTTQFLHNRLDCCPA